MVDIHNHILYGIDDGCKTIEESIITLKEAEENNVKSIILTPHYIKGSKFNCNNEKKKKLFEELKNVASSNGIKVDLYLGNEVYVENDMTDLLNSGEILTLNESKYLLFELPMGSEINNLADLIFDLRVHGIIPIIAHPERYGQFQENPGQLLKYIEQGCLFQGNLGSLTGIYGRRAQKCIKILLKHNYIHFMASDAHHPNSRNYRHLSEAINELRKIVGDEYCRDLTENYPQFVIQNDIFEIREPKVIKKKFFSFNT